jgi:hypothetical protein
MIELDYDDFQELMSHSASWIQSELGEQLAEVLMEELNEIN